MRRRSITIAGRLGALFAAALLSIPAVTSLSRHAAAEEVRIEHLGLALVGNVALPEGRKLGDGRVAIVLHGSLAHNGMEIIATLQKNLRSRGIASLAPTLSLGLDARRGMRDCALEHDHRSSDAGDEIAAWLHWLRERGVRQVALVGHSRGAEQIAHAAADMSNTDVDRIVLVAPPSEPPAAVAERYRKAWGGDLAALLARAKKLSDDGEEDTVLDAPGFLHCKDARVTAGTFLDYYDLDEARAALALVPKLAQPVLVVAASADTISPGVAERARAVAGSKAKLVVVDGADHFFRDLFADDLADHVAGFVGN